MMGDVNWKALVIVALLAAAVAAVVASQQVSSPVVSDLSAGSPRSRAPAGLLKLEKKFTPVRSAGGTVSSFSGDRLRLRTLRFISPDSNNPTATEERDIMVPGGTKVFRVETTEQEKLRRVPAGARDIRVGDSITVRTDGDFSQPGALTATQIDIIPSGTSFLPFE
ncbi:hypothetical protein HY573_01590 [Candidatus Parcubacteria bacterium]|nr:hypothetical protein [Candidatus Parcubacteria bacterium]